MIETRIPADIRQYKTKVLGPFSIRAVVLIAIAAVVDLAIYFLIVKPTGSDMSLFLPIIIPIDLIILIFLKKVDGMPMEKYLTKVVYKAIIWPSKRKAVSKIEREQKPSEMTSKQAKAHSKAIKKMLKKEPEMTGYL